MMALRNVFAALDPTDDSVPLRLGDETFASVAEYALSLALPESRAHRLFAVLGSRSLPDPTAPGRLCFQDPAGRQWTFFLFAVDFLLETELLREMTAWAQTQILRDPALSHSLAVATHDAFDVVRDPLFREALLTTRRRLWIEAAVNARPPDRRYSDAELRRVRAYLFAVDPFVEKEEVALASPDVGPEGQVRRSVATPLLPFDAVLLDAFLDLLPPLHPFVLHFSSLAIVMLWLTNGKFFVRFLDAWARYAVAEALADFEFAGADDLRSSLVLRFLETRGPEINDIIEKGGLGHDEEAHVRLFGAERWRSRLAPRLLFLRRAQARLDYYERHVFAGHVEALLPGTARAEAVAGLENLSSLERAIDAMAVAERRYSLLDLHAKRSVLPWGLRPRVADLRAVYRRRIPDASDVVFRVPPAALRAYLRAGRKDYADRVLEAFQTATFEKFSSSAFLWSLAYQRQYPPSPLPWHDFQILSNVRRPVPRPASFDRDLRKVVSLDRLHLVPGAAAFFVAKFAMLNRVLGICHDHRDELARFWVQPSAHLTPEATARLVGELYDIPPALLTPLPGQDRLPSEGFRRVLARVVEPAFLDAWFDVFWLAATRTFQDRPDQTVAWWKAQLSDVSVLLAVDAAWAPYVRMALAPPLVRLLEAKPFLVWPLTSAYFPLDRLRPGDLFRLVFNAPIERVVFFGARAQRTFRGAAVTLDDLRALKARWEGLGDEERRQRVQRTLVPRELALPEEMRRPAVFWPTEARLAWAETPGRFSPPSLAGLRESALETTSPVALTPVAHLDVLERLDDLVQLVGREPAPQAPAARDVLQLEEAVRREFLRVRENVSENERALRDRLSELETLLGDPSSRLAGRDAMEAAVQEIRGALLVQSADFSRLERGWREHNALVEQEIGALRADVRLLAEGTLSRAEFEARWNALAANLGRPPEAPPVTGAHLDDFLARYARDQEERDAAVLRLFETARSETARFLGERLAELQRLLPVDLAAELAALRQREGETERRLGELERLLGLAGQPGLVREVETLRDVLREGGPLAQRLDAGAVEALTRELAELRRRHDLLPAQMERAMQAKAEEVRRWVEQVRALWSTAREEEAAEFARFRDALLPRMGEIQNALAVEVRGAVERIARLEADRGRLEAKVKRRDDLVGERRLAEANRVDAELDGLRKAQDLLRREVESRLLAVDQRGVALATALEGMRHFPEAVSPQDLGLSVQGSVRVLESLAASRAENARASSEAAARLEALTDDLAASVRASAGLAQSLAADPPRDTPQFRERVDSLVSRPLLPPPAPSPEEEALDVEMASLSRSESVAREQLARRQKVVLSARAADRPHLLPLEDALATPAATPAPSLPGPSSREEEGWAFLRERGSTAMLSLLLPPGSPPPWPSQEPMSGSSTPRTVPSRMSTPFSEKGYVERSPPSPPYLPFPPAPSSRSEQGPTPIPGSPASSWHSREPTPLPSPAPSWHSREPTPLSGSSTPRTVPSGMSTLERSSSSSSSPPLPAEEEAAVAEPPPLPPSSRKRKERPWEEESGGPSPGTSWLPRKTRVVPVRLKETSGARTASRPTLAPRQWPPPSSSSSPSSTSQSIVEAE